MISTWGFVIVASSFMFLYVGRWIDTKFNTEPSFMFGLFILAIGLCIWRLYGEALLNMERQKKNASNGYLINNRKPPPYQKDGGFLRLKIHRQPSSTQSKNSFVLPKFSAKKNL